MSVELNTDTANWLFERRAHAVNRAEADLDRAGANLKAASRMTRVPSVTDLGAAQVRLLAVIAEASRALASIREAEGYAQLLEDAGQDDY